MRLKILHVDDNRDDAELVQFKLSRTNEEENIEIDWVGSASEAIEALKKDHYDCIICDFQMPQMDGLGLLKVLRTQDLDIPFIFLTGQGNEQLAARALREGADDYYTKELGFAHYERLINSIHRLVENKIERSKRRRSEKKILQMAETAIDMIITHDVSGMITYINGAVCKISGYTEEEILGKHILDFVPQTYHEDLQMRIQSRMVGFHGRFNYEVEFISKEGNFIPLDVNSSMLKEDGRPSEVIIFARDISDRRNNEKLLRESEENFRLLFDLAPAGFFMLNDKGEFLKANRFAEECFGSHENQLSGQRFDEIKVLDKTVKQDIKELMRESVKATALCTMEFQAGLKDQPTKNLEMHMITAEILGKHVVLGSVIDISQRKLAGRKLQESELRYRTLFETANDSIFMMSKEIFIDCNSRTLDIFGCERDDIVGSTPFKFSPEKQPNGELSVELGRNYIEKALAGNPQIFPWQHIKLNGTPFMAEVSLNSLKLQDEQYLQAIVRVLPEKPS